jgi:hypothetical protein
MRTITLEQPDLEKGFVFYGGLTSPAHVFSPIPLRARVGFPYGSTIGDHLTVQVSFVIGSRVFSTMHSLREPGGVIDLSGIARAMFDPGDFKGAPETGDPLLVVVALNAVALTPSGAVPLAGDGDVPLTLVWGARPVLSTPPLARIPRWAGLPFTVPLLVEDGEAIRVTYTAGGLVTGLGVFGPGKYNLRVPGTAPSGTFEFAVDPDAGPYDVTFDDTFKPVPLSTRRLAVRERSCPSRGTYLRWVDTAGDWRYYLFDDIREEERVTDVAPSVEAFYDDVAFSPVDPGDYYHPGTGSHPSGKGVVIARVVGAASLDADEYRLASGVARSAIVHLFDGWESDSEGVSRPRWARVNVEPVTLSRGAGVTLSDITLNVILPDGGGPSL